MVYSNKFVMAVLVNGEPQNELANGVVKLPFGAEYTLRFRNKNNRRAVVKIFVDGENVSGGGYVVPANNFVDIKRHHDKDRAFKFVSLDSPDAVDFGKNGPNEDKQKGVIEARFYLEKEYKAPQVVHHHHHHDHWHPRPTWWPHLTNPYGSALCSNDSSLESFSSNSIGGQSSPPTSSYKEIAKGGTTRDCAAGPESMSRRARLCGAGGSSAGGATSCSVGGNTPSFGMLTDSAPALKDGCTVEGMNTGQNFQTVYLEYETDFVSLKVFLQGFTPETQTVEDKPVRATNKDNKLKSLENENEELRRQLAELENNKLKTELEEKKAKSKAAPKKKKTKG